MPRSRSAAAIPPSDVTPDARNSAMTGAISAALAADTGRRVAREARLAPSSTTWPRKPPKTRPRALAAASALLVRSEIAFAS